MSNNTEIFEIALSDPNGVRLLTKDKICDKDIDVIPKLQDVEVTENRIVTPDPGFAGIRKVTVNVDVPVAPTYFDPETDIIVSE